MRTLSSELRAMRATRRDVQGKTGGMDFQTMSAIAKALHPDHTAERCGMGGVARDKALKLFTAWKADRDRVRRQAR